MNKSFKKVLKFYRKKSKELTKERKRLECEKTSLEFMVDSYIAIIDRLSVYESTVFKERVKYTLAEYASELGDANARIKVLKTEIDSIDMELQAIRDYLKYYR